LQSQLAKTARKRLSLSGLELLHGRLLRVHSVPPSSALPLLVPQPVSIGKSVG
jgi:hypothetical protein